jgi:hypothetical protein
MFADSVEGFKLHAEGFDLSSELLISKQTEYFYKSLQLVEMSHYGVQ